VLNSTEHIKIIKSSNRYIFINLKEILKVITIIVYNIIFDIEQEVGYFINGLH
jgi:hypothetical protein